MGTGKMDSSSVSCFTCSTAEQHSKNHQKLMVSSTTGSAEMTSMHVSYNDPSRLSVEKIVMLEALARRMLQSCSDFEPLEPAALTDIGCGCPIGGVGLKTGRCLMDLSRMDLLLWKNVMKRRKLWKVRTTQAATGDRNRKWLSNQPCGPGKWHPLLNLAKVTPHYDLPYHI